MNWTLGYMGKGDQSARGEFLRDTGETDFSFSIEALKRLIQQGRTPKLYRDELFLNNLSNELNKLSYPSIHGRQVILNIIGNELVSKTDHFIKSIDSSLSSKNFDTDNEKDQIETVEQLTELLTELGIYDNIVDADITNELIKENIEKIDSSFSVDDVEALVEEALTPLFTRAELSADQKAKIVYASSMTFKACVDSNNGLANGDDKVSSFDANVVTVALPSEAPATWKADKLAGETPPLFITRVYREWLGTGLTVADLRKLDPSLVRALAHHQNQGREMPDGFDLPLGKRGPKIETGDSTSPEVNDPQGVLRTYWRERQSQTRTKVKLAIPQAAPALWKNDKQPAETPPQFIQRIYGEWLGRGLDRPTVRRLDPSLGQALDNWLQRNDMPPDLDLPTAKERSAREISALKELAKDSSLHRVLGNFTAREASRIRSNIARHEG